MSEIKFLKALGDEVERAAAARIAGRRGRIRRRLAIGGLGFAIAVGGAAAAPAIFQRSRPARRRKRRLLRARRA